MDGALPDPQYGIFGVGAPRCGVRAARRAGGYGAGMEPGPHLVPQGDLPRVPARDPRGEQPLRAAQEDHAVDAVVLAAGLLQDRTGQVSDTTEKPPPSPKQPIFCPPDFRRIPPSRAVSTSGTPRTSLRVSVGFLPVPPTPNPPRGPRTCSTLPERGSTTRSFLSLQEVASRLPSVLKDMQRMTSVWQSIILTGSPMSRFQMRTCGGGEGGGRGCILAIPRSISELKPLAQPLQSSSPALLGLAFVPNPRSPCQRVPGTTHTGTWPSPGGGGFRTLRSCPGACRCFPLVPRCRAGAHLIVVARAEEDVVGGGVPLDQADAPAVPVQLQDGLGHVPLQAALGDLPYPHLRDGARVRGGFGDPPEAPVPHPEGLWAAPHGQLVPWG